MTRVLVTSEGRTLLVHLILKELEEARRKWPEFNSYHEGYAILLEEVDELWEEIKGGQDPDKLLREAIQVAAMAMRFIEDTTPPLDWEES